MRRYVLIGGGVASIAALEAIRQVDSAGDVLLIGDESHGYYSRPGLAFYLTGELPEAYLFPMKNQDYLRLNVRRVRAKAVRIHPGEHTVQLQDGRLVPYDRLLVAVGAEAQMAKVPGIELDGVIKLDSLDDARTILQKARRGRTAVVVGGGITALEIVEGLVARRVRTHYFLRGERYWSNVLDETEARIVEERLREEGVKIHYHTELEAILGKGGSVTGVRTKDGTVIPCDLVGVAIGIRPRLELAQASGIQVERGVQVSETLQTNVEDVFAAGDIAQVYDPHTGKSVLDSLWGPAREQGYAAGSNMAGFTTAYRKPVAFNVTRLANLTTTIIGTVGHGEDSDVTGIVRGDSETWRQLPDAIAAQADFDINRLRLLVGVNTLLGAIVMGDQTLSRPLQHLITQGADITPIRQRLLQPGAALVDVVADFWTAWRGKVAVPA